MYDKITSFLSKEKVSLKETKKSVTPVGGVFVFLEYLKRIGFQEVVASSMPFALRSPNATPPIATFTVFLMAVACGARRYSHTGLLRHDEALRRLLGIKRMPSDDTIRNLFLRFGQGAVYAFYSSLFRWLLAQLPAHESGYSLLLDSTVFERYGNQEGSKKGHNPRKHGRPSHHPLLALLSEAPMFLNGWLRSGNTASARGVVEFLKESLALLPPKIKISLVRADSGFADQNLFDYLEQEDVGLSYIIASRLTSWVKKEIRHVQSWTALDENYDVGELLLQLSTWKKARRFVVIREKIREEKSPVGRKLFDLPEYTFRVFITNMSLPPQEIWRQYDHRAVIENHIGELKHDLAADDFCMKKFFPTEATFMAVLFLFNLLALFQKIAYESGYRRPATIRAKLFMCGAIIGKAGRETVLFLSSSWGGLYSRKPLLDRIRQKLPITSPKLEYG